MSKKKDEKKKEVLPTGRVIGYALWLYREKPEVFESILGDNAAGCIVEFLKGKKFFEEELIAEFVSDLLRELTEGEGTKLAELLEFCSNFKGQTKHYSLLKQEAVFENEYAKQLFEKYNIYPFIAKLFADPNLYKGTEIEGLFIAMDIQPLETFDRDKFISLLMEEKV